MKTRDQQVADQLHFASKALEELERMMLGLVQEADMAGAHQHSALYEEVMLRLTKAKHAAEAAAHLMASGDPADGSTWIQPGDLASRAQEMVERLMAQTCPTCKGSDVRRASVYWQCLTCGNEWL